MIVPEIFAIPVITVLTGQLIKLLLLKVHKQPITWRALAADGGMPSAHTALMTSVSVTIFLIEGFSTTFFLAVFVSLVVMKDAFGVRRESGKHARVLREIMDDFQLEDKEHIKLVVGHTKWQVFFGFWLGLFMALLLDWVLF